jgi:hypothetical protein
VTAAAVVLGATVSASLWWLAGARQALGDHKDDWVNVIYSQIGIPYPRTSMVAASVIGAAMGFVLIWLVTAEAEAAKPLGPAPGPNLVPALKPATAKTDTQRGSVNIHERKDERITVRYSRPFVRAPNLRHDIRGGWAKYEIVEEEPDKFVFRATEIIGSAVLFWSAEGTEIKD